MNRKKLQRHKYFILYIGGDSLYQTKNLVGAWVGKSTMAFHSSGAGKPKGREKSCVPALIRVYNKFWIWGVNIFVEPISAEKPKFVGHMENITVDAGTAKITFICTLTNIGGHKVCTTHLR